MIADKDHCQQRNTMLRSGVTKLTNQGRSVIRAKANRRLLASNTTTLHTNHASLLSTATRCCFSNDSTSWDRKQQQQQQHQKGGEAKQPWQAEGAIDIQRVTQQAMIHELISQQTDTIQKVVPWFLNNMPPSYFNQVPEKFRLDHIKAIAAIQGKIFNFFYVMEMKVCSAYTHSQH